MSHFVTVVLVPPQSDKNAKGYIENVLKPYDENSKVPEYETDCYCIDRLARQAAVKTADAQHGTIEALRKRYAALIQQKVKATLPGRKEPKWDDKSPEAKEWRQVERAARRETPWTEFIAPYVQTEKEVFESHPMRGKPDPHCGFYRGPRQEWWSKDAKPGDRFEDGSGCGGTGKVTSTYNPKSKWDWWRIGGRWDGWITQKESGGDGFNFDEKHEGLKKNSLPASKYLEDIDHYLSAMQGKLSQEGKEFSSPLEDLGEEEEEDKTHRPIPYALVDLEGNWHQKGEMGWFGMSRDEQSELAWANEVRGIVAKAPPGTLAVACDLHI